MVVKEIMCDGDRSNYASKQFNDMLKKRHVRKLSTPEYEPAYNGLIECTQGVVDSLTLSNHY